MFLFTPAAVNGEILARKGELSKTFEFRYVSDVTDADGETDFKGETEFFDTEQRIEFLSKYAEYAKRFFHDPELNQKVVSEKEIITALQKLKPQPFPHIRTRIPLDEWKWLGYRDGQCNESAQALSSWNSMPGIEINKKALEFTGETANFERNFQPQSWRFSFLWKAKVQSTDSRGVFCLSDRKLIAGVKVGFNCKGRFFTVPAIKRLNLKPIRLTHGTSSR